MAVATTRPVTVPPSSSSVIAAPNQKTFGMIGNSAAGKATSAAITAPINMPPRLPLRCPQSAAIPPARAPTTPAPNTTRPIQPANCAGVCPKLRDRTGAAQIAAAASAISTLVCPTNIGRRNARRAHSSRATILAGAEMVSRSCRAGSRNASSNRVSAALPRPRTR